MTQEDTKIIVESSPHLSSAESIPRIMWTVALCLIPSGAMSMLVFGPATVWIIISAVLGAVITELISCRLRKKPLTLMDGSAVLTGILLAYNLPPQSPLWMAFLGGSVAIFLGKVLFGGLGFNIFNPALIGRVFLMASFPQLMTRWPAPFGIDAATAPTPLAVFKDGFANTNILTQTEIINYSYSDLFLGLRGGCIGEACILALLLGAAYLVYKQYITLEVPLSFIGTVGIFSWIFSGSGFFKGDFLIHVLSGGLILGAFYMATDYVTGPITKKGKLVFGVGCGLITCLIRLWGGYPEGVSYAILLMNVVTPLIDKFTVPKRFGEVR
ncbi:MAG: RnfABCDGE type electron transport complex subunit D [Candidatus Omnitrophica bacterium]|nr:RnfABCDGE type electron transport complex subunit D [Candidatus Omnitrophota bacterium]